MITQDSQQPIVVAALIARRQRAGVTEFLNVLAYNTYLDVFDSLTPEGRDIKMYVFSGSVAENITPNREISELHWLTYNQMVDRKELLTPMTIGHIMPMLKHVVM